MKQVITGQVPMKYRSIKAGKYDSKKEQRRANELKMLEKAGRIAELKEQVQFELIPAQYRLVNGRKTCIEREVRYYADFTYVENGNLIVEDVKGMRTKDYILKRKLMLSVHGIRIKEV